MARATGPASFIAVGEQSCCAIMQSKVHCGWLRNAYC